MERTLNVKRLTVEKTGGGRNGNKPWTLYNVVADVADGGPALDLPLRTFDALDAGEARFTLEDYKGEAYTLKPVGKRTRPSGGNRTTASGDDTATKRELQSLRKQVGEMDDRLKRAEAALRGILHDEKVQL